VEQEHQEEAPKHESIPISLTVGAKLVSMVESAASKDLHTFIGALQNELLRGPQEAFMAEKYGAKPIKTYFKHTPEAIEAAKVKFVKQQMAKGLADQLKGTGISARGGVEGLSRAECKQVGDLIKKQASE